MGDMTTAHQFDTECIASLLDERYPVAAFKAGRFRLQVPAATLNAVDWLRNQGIDATARSEGGWTVQV